MISDDDSDASQVKTRARTLVKTHKTHHRLFLDLFTHQTSQEKKAGQEK